MALRPEPSVQYKRLIKRTLVSALRTVFSYEYPDPQLRELYISTDHPLKREDFPGIIVKYNETSVMNAGVGHMEYLMNDDFLTVPAKHFKFDGTIDFTCVALSPLDLDILTDSVVELVAFGRLDFLLNKFFDVIYKDVDDSAQITFHSDVLRPLGQSTTNTLWGSEDGLVYQSGYSIACSGGFYSTVRDEDISNYVEDIIVYGNQPFEEEQEKLLEIIGNNTLDPFYVRGRAKIFSEQDTN